MLLSTIINPTLYRYWVEVEELLCKVNVMTTNTLTPALKPSEIEYIPVPTIRNLRESSLLCLDYEAVLTAGPLALEVDWGHPNHTVLEFDDTIDPFLNAPQMWHIEKIVEFSLQNNSRTPLIHCHAGMSRSTASGIIYLLANDVDAELAISTLASIHPEGRTFSPNVQMISLAAEFFSIPELPELTEPYYYFHRKP